MEQLNYHHLFHFATVVREGSLVAAGRRLGVSHTTLSSQIHALEESLGETLMERRGRRLSPTDMGRVVSRYADEIFGLGRELVDTVRGRPTGKPARLRVGIVDVLPKLVVRSLLEPAFSADPPLHVVCYEDSHERVVGMLALHEADVAFADAPAPAGGAVRVYNHHLGDCDVTLYGAPRFEGLRSGFPRSLDGAPMLLPLDGSPLRRALNQWFDANEIRPRIVAEFEDSALLKVVGQDGAGVFASPSVVDREVRRQYGVRAIGRLPQVREQFYAISLERRLRDPALVAILGAARSSLFASSARRKRSADGG